MKIFEFRFNPKAKKDRVFRVFSFEEEGEQGNLYILGELQHVLPINVPFLQTLAERIHKEYVASAKTQQGKKRTYSPTTHLKASLRKVNEFLAAESKKGNVDWLGNLHLAIVLFVPAAYGYTLYFTKVGGAKIWMARNGSLVDVGMSLEKEQDQASPKVFGNIGSGKIMPNDNIALVTPELFESFAKENMLQTMGQFAEEKQFKNLFKGKEKVLSAVSGMFMFFVVEQTVHETEGQLLRFPSLSGRFSGMAFPFSLPMLSFQGMIPPVSFVGQWAERSMHALHIPVHIRIAFASFQNVPLIKKGLALAFVLVVVLGIGFALFQDGSFVSQETQEAQETLEKVQALLLQAEQKLALQQENEAAMLYEEALRFMQPYAEFDEFIPRIQETETQLRKLYHIELAENLHRVATFDNARFSNTPDTMIVVGETIYILPSGTQELAAIDIATQSMADIPTSQNVAFASRLGDSFALFAKPNTMLTFNELVGWKEHHLDIVENRIITGMATFGSGVYVFDGPTGRILKGSMDATTITEWVHPTSAKKPLDATSIAIDGNIWVLTSQGEIQRYFKGQYEESLQLHVFPRLQNPTKIHTRAELEHIYILDASNSRVLVLTKLGDIVRQFQNPAFASATDFAISANGKTLYILASSNIYSIEL